MRNAPGRMIGSGAFLLVRLGFLAEDEGFEPSFRFPENTLSKREP